VAIDGRGIAPLEAADAASVELLLQQPDRAEFCVAAEDRAHDLGLAWRAGLDRRDVIDSEGEREIRPALRQHWRYLVRSLGRNIADIGEAFGAQ
jgi:hypothetical protein